jgi:acetyl/propionyl-CoA carboxylase alpha subunit
MRVQPAEQFKTSRRIAMVLGTPGIGDLICSELRSLGFEASLAPVEIQRAASLGWAGGGIGASPDDLRQELRNWVQTQPKGSLWLHPGISPWAERPELPTVGQELGIHVIAPPPRALSLFGNRLALLGEGEKLSIPSLSLSPDPLHSVREIERFVKTQKLKLPFVLKAVRGGSGYGIRTIHSPEDLGKSLALWLEQLHRSLGEVILLAERYLEGARRITQPFARFSDGTFQIFPAIDSSLLCRFRKLVEFCPASEGAEENSLTKVQQWTEALATRIGFVGVGSLEFLIDGSRGYLIEGVPRLNTSFPLWEKVAGTSAVAWQLATLQSDPSLASVSTPAREWKSALALRIYAEDPLLQLPQPGKIHELSEGQDWSFPGATATFSPTISAGQELAGAATLESSLETRFGGLLGHVWVGAEDRKRAITVAKGVLDQIWIAGSLQTNERFLQELMGHPWIQEGMFHAGFIDEEFIPGVRPSQQMLTTFLQVSELCAGPIPSSSSNSMAPKWAVGDLWLKSDPKASEIDWKKGPEFFEVEGQRGLSGAINISGKAHRVLCYPAILPSGLPTSPLSGSIGGSAAGPSASLITKWMVRIGPWTFSTRRVLPQPKSADGQKPSPKLMALVPGRVHSILFQQGAAVPAHETVLVIESLGALIPHALPIDVRIGRWQVAAQANVQTGQVLADLETSR